VLPQEISTVSRVGFVTAPTSLNGRQPNFSRCLTVSWAGTLYMHFLWAPAPKGSLPGAKFTSRPSLALSYNVSVIVRHSSSGRQPNLAAWYLHTTGRPSRSTLGSRIVYFVLLSVDCNLVLSVSFCCLSLR